MKRRFTLMGVAILFAAGLVQAQVNNPAAPTAISIAAKNTPYNQNFDQLDTSTTLTTLTNLPAGWQISEIGTGANGSYRGGAGTATAGDIYSFGTVGTTERTLGALASGSVQGRFGAFFKNTTGSAVDSVKIEFTMEQWRNGGPTTRTYPDTVYFDYAVNKVSIDTSTGAWTRVIPLSLVSKVYSGTAGALNGNQAANQIRYSMIIPGLTINNGDSFCIRFVDIDVLNSDEGLGIDSFSLTMDPLVTTPQPVTSLAITPSLNSAAVAYTAPGNFNSSTMQYLAFLKQGSAITQGTPTRAASYYTANNDFSSTGTAYQNDASAKCVYKGTGSSFNITGLNPATTYYLAIYTISNSDSVYSGAATAQTTTARTNVFFTSKFNTAGEGAGTQNISVSITNPGVLATDTTFVDLVLTGGDATNGTDISNYSTVTLKFPGASTTAKTQTITITNDNSDEWDEVLTFSLRNVTGGALAVAGADSVYNMTLQDDDGVLNPSNGDIVFTQMQTDDPNNNFEFITLKRLDLRNFTLTDRGVLADNTIQPSGENYNIFPSTSYYNNIPAGTVVRFVEGTAANDTDYTDGVMTFNVASWGLSGSGEQMIALTGFNNYVAGYNMANSGWTAGATNTNDSKAPGTSSDFNSTSLDNAKFRGPVTGNAGAIRSAAINIANWDSSDTRFANDFYPIGVLFDQPSSQATAFTFTSTGLSSLGMRWNKATSNPHRYVVVMHTASNGSDPADSVSYRNINNYTQADTVVTALTGMTKGNGRVVYSGEDTSVTVTGLNNGTQYFVKVYAFNGNGRDANYNVTSAPGGDTTTVSPTVPVVKFTPVSKTISEDTVTVTAIVSISNPDASATSVTVAIKGGTATAGTDYNYTNQVVTFPASSSTPQQVTLAIVNDILVEGTETILLALRNATNSAIIDVDSVFTINLNDNDTAPELKFVPISKTVTEDTTTVNFSVALAYASPNATSVNIVTKGGTATGGGVDYTLNTTSVTFPPNTTTAQNVSVSIVNDVLIEGTETATFALRGATNGAVLHADSVFTLTIGDNDFTKLSFVNTKETYSETADTLRIKVRMQNYGTGTYTVSVGSLNGSAVTTQDYTLITTSLTFTSATDTLKDVLVKVFRTQPFESAESFILTLSGATNGAQVTPNTQDTINLNNYVYPYHPIGQVNTVDANGVLDSLGRYYQLRGIVYGITNRPAGIQFTLRDATGGITVFHTNKNFGYTVTQGDSVIVYGIIAQFNGLAELGGSGTVAFPFMDTLILAGTGKPVKSPTLITAMSETTENDFVYFASLTLADPAQWPTTAGAAKNLYAYVNGNTSDSIQVRLLANCALNGSPAPTRPFALMGLVGQFDPSNPFTSGYQLIPQFTSHLVNGDTLSFATATASVNENAGTVTITVNLKNPNFFATSVDVVVTGGTATAGSDYTYSTQTVTFPANSNTSQTVTVNIADDALFEPVAETIILKLQNATNNALISATADTYTITINDNDPNGVAPVNALHFNMYPNPASSQVVIASDEQIESISISNLVGSEVMTLNGVNAQKQEIPTGALKPGVYFVRVNNGTASGTKKLVIQ